MARGAPTSTGQIGPREEPEKYPTSLIANDCGWAELWEKEAHERSIQEWQAQIESRGFASHPCIPSGPPPKKTSSMRVLPNVYDALRHNDPSMAPGSQPVLKKAPPSAGRPRPKAFYSEGLVQPQHSLHRHQGLAHGIVSLQVDSVHQHRLL